MKPIHPFISGPLRSTSEILRQVRYSTRIRIWKEVGAGVAFFLVTWAIASRLNAFENITLYAQRHEPMQMDEIFTALMLLPAALAAFYLFRWRDYRRIVIANVQSAQRAKQTEDRMRFAMEAAHAGIWDFDAANSTMVWSEILEGLHGLTPGSFAGTPAAFTQLIHPDDRHLLQTAIDAEGNEKAQESIAYRTIWPDGSIHWIRGIGQTVFGADGKTLRSAGISFDITESRVLEARSRQARKLEAVGQLAGGIAHDFNNILTVILAYGAMACESLDAQAAEQGYIKEILAAANRAAALTRQLLAFSHKDVVAPRAISISDSVREMEPMLRRLIGENIRLVVHTKVAAAQIMADKGHVEQVIMNLVVNARDAMPDGGQITIETEVTSDGSAFAHKDVCSLPYGCVVLTVADTGVGMDAGTIAQIYEPFFTTKPIGKGTGLGLSTVYGIVEQSGAAMDVRSTPGDGTTFKVFFPRIASTDVAAASKPEGAFIAGKETILVLEDDAAVRRMTGRALQNVGYRTLMAESPAQAIDIAQVHGSGIDLLLTDYVLPGMNGLTLSNLLREQIAHLPVIIMSGYADDERMQSAIARRETVYLQKPFSRDELLACIGNALRPTVTATPVIPAA